MLSLGVRIAISLRLADRLLVALTDCGMGHLILGQKDLLAVMGQ